MLAMMVLFLAVFVVTFYVTLLLVGLVFDSDMTFWQEIGFGVTLLIVGLVLEKAIDWYWPNRDREE